MITIDALKKLVWDAALEASEIGAFKGTTNANKEFFKIDIEPAKPENQTPELFPVEKQNGEFTESELNEGLTITRAANEIGIKESLIRREIRDGNIEIFRKTDKPKGYIYITRRELLKKRENILRRILLG